MGEWGKLVNANAVPYPGACESATASKRIESAFRPTQSGNGEGQACQARQNQGGGEETPTNDVPVQVARMFNNAERST